jgi:ABC-type multidrug transport system permease subunit
MNLDDLMEVWRSQDASPLHGVNETLLRLALRQDEARLRALQRREEWITYLVSAFVVAFMAFFVVMEFGMLFYNDDDVITGWDFVVPIVGVVPAVLMGVALYVSRRAQMLREQRFGESLRDQLGRLLAQLDYQSTRAVWLGGAIVSAAFVGVLAISIASARVNMEPNEPFPGWARVVRVILVGALFGVLAVRAARRRAKQVALPRKRQLEALLKELDGP